MPTSAQEIIDKLQLQPHPEGGWYREYWRGPSSGPAGRGTGTAIYYLLPQGQKSHWHRIDASELWLYQAGGPLRLMVAQGDAIVEHLLGPDIQAGETLHMVIEPGVWQAATPEAAWTLVSCVVTPAFEFSGFEMAPAGWQPGNGQ
jgi:predicted cupin superfamily sugar epimerase